VHHLTSLADFAAVATAMGWPFEYLGTPHVLPISDDLVADVALVLDAASVPRPSNCSLDGGCPAPFYRETLFPRRDAVHVPGLTCVSPGPFPSKGCAGMTIAQGTTFRIRPIVEVGVFGRQPYVDFDRACNTACTDDESRCDANQTCLRRGFDTCAWCEGMPSAVCACRDRCQGTMPDGVQCIYDLSDDQLDVGTCHAGLCCGGAVSCPDH
jgi:hypothetical protein